MVHVSSASSYARALYYSHVPNDVKLPTIQLLPHWPQACEAAHNLLTKSEILCCLCCVPLCPKPKFMMFMLRSRNRTETATKLDGPDVGSSILSGSNQNFTDEAIERQGIHDNLEKRKVWNFSRTFPTSLGFL